MDQGIHRVLIVDDEKLVREGLARSIDWPSMGFQVCGTCNNGLEGLDAVHTLSPDLCVSDIRMPKMTGLEMLQRLRAEGSTIDVIFLTAYSDFNYARDALRLLAADYLLKPFEDEEFEAAVAKVVKRRGWKIPPSGSETSAAVPPDLPGEQRAIAPALRDPVTDNLYCRRAMQYIKEHYGERTLSVCAVSEALGISDGYLTRQFRANTGITPAQYITMIRIRNAKSLLQMHAYKVYEIAGMCGYSDIAYFSTTFRKYVGCTPSDYQNQFRS